MGTFTTAITVAAWDEVLNISGFGAVPVDAPLTLPEAGVSTGGGGSSLDYFVRFTLSDGSTLTVNGDQLMALQDFSFGDEIPVSIGSATGGAGAGKVKFDPLELTFSQSDLDPQLFKMLAEGSHFKEVDVLGYHAGADGSHLAVDYSFGTVFPDRLDFDGSGKTHLELQYGAEEIQQFDQNPDGSFPSIPNEVAAWNAILNVSGFGAVPVDAPLTLPEDGVSLGGGSSLDYFVRFTLSNGSTLTVSGNQFFELDAFSFGDENAVSIGSATGGAGAGKVSFNPLELTFSQPDLDPQLFKMLAEGSHFKEVDVLGYHAGADGSHLAVDYSFGTVFPDRLDFDGSGKTHLELQYGAEEIQQFDQNPDGSFPSTPNEVAAWNAILNVSGFGAVPVAAPLTLPEDGVSLGGGSSLDYFVRFTLSNGSTLTVSGNQFFELDAFSFGDENAVSIGSATGGAGAGKVSFNPLELTFSQPDLDPQLFKMLAEGSHFKEVDVLGYHAGADGSHLAVDYSFGTVFADKLALDASGKTQLELQYGAEEIQQFDQNPDGSFPSTPNEVAAWNAILNVSGFGAVPVAAPLTLPEDGVSTGGGGSSLDYFVRFTLSNGSTLTVNGDQLFELQDFSFGDENAVSIGSATGGAGAGKISFNPLELTFSQPDLDPQLFKMLAEGSHFKEVDVLGYHAGADGSHLAVDYSFGTVFPDKLGLDASGKTQLELQYGAEEIQQFDQNPDGSFPSTPNEVAAWNAILNVSGFGAVPVDAPLTLPEDGVSTGGGGSSLDYFVRFTLSDGSTLTVNGDQLIALQDFSFGDENIISIGSATGGAGAGKVTFDPLELTFGQLGLDPQLFKMLAQGSHFKEVDVLGYHAGADSSPLVVDYSFGTVFADKLALDASGKSHLELQYGAEEIQQFDQNPDGSSRPGPVAAWDRIRNVSGFSSPQPIAAPPTLPEDGVSAGGASSLDYFVRFTQSNGITLTVSGNQFFELEGFSFGAENPVSIGSATGGAGAGKVTFNPLELTFSQPDLDPQLFKTLAQGSHFKEVDVLGYHAGADSSPLVVDYSFGIAFADKLGLDASGKTQLELQYGAVEIQVSGNQPPVAVDDTGSALAGGTAAGNVLANDSDPDGDTLGVSAVDGSSVNVGAPLVGTYGHLTLNEDGSYSYAADNAAAIAAGSPGSHLEDSFTYTASDRQGGFANASLDITLDRLPVVADDTGSALAGGTAAGNVLANDSDPDGDTLTVSAVDGLSFNGGAVLVGSYGHLTTNGNGSYSYSADDAAAIAAGSPGSHLEDSFTYTASDEQGGFTNASLDITLDRLPVVTADLAGVQIGKTISGNVLANDHDPDGDPLVLVGVNGGSLGHAIAGKFGTLVLNGDGSYSYASNKGAPLPSQGVAQDGFSYSESDGHGGVVPGTLTITIVPGGTNYIAGTPGTTTNAGNGKGIIDGSLGEQILVGGNGADTLIGGPHDTLTGGNGPDTFEIGAASGPNTITDFDVHNDTIVFDRSLFASFADVVARTKQVGADAVITVHGTDTLTLQHVSASSLRASDFSFGTVAFGASSTLGFAGNTLTAPAAPGGDTQAGALALLGQYSTAGFVSSGSSQGRPADTDPLPNQQLILAPSPA